ncbi:hypothetical protein EV421DRAFT_1782459 [Armillaria borealis]|uniref:Uncharacterized protein n=1 Tax=Armillaria borealis TaxID=47425 RepID=A0AA39MWS6_9AGAR|nr:hypothetical protein EV421DRAFT_1782459 [Armillaria borealis]
MLDHYYLRGYATPSLTTTVRVGTSSSGGGTTSVDSSWETPRPGLEAATHPRATNVSTHRNSTTLNQTATPFVSRNSIHSLLQPKSQTHTSKIAQTKANSRDSEEPTWNSAFIAECLEDPFAKWNVARHASQIVCSPWFSLKQDLSIKFCQRARVQEMGGGPESLAPFATEIHRTIHVFFGPHAAWLFRKKLASLVVRTFIEMGYQNTKGSRLISKTRSYSCQDHHDASRFYYRAPRTSTICVPEGLVKGT